MTDYRMDLGLDLTNASRELERFYRESEKFANRAGALLGKSAISGLNKSQKAYGKLFAEQKDHLKKLHRYEEKLRHATARNNQTDIKKFERLRTESLKRIDRIQHKMYQREERINKLYAERHKARKQYADYMKDAETSAEKAGKVLGDASRGIAESVSDLTNALRSGDFSALASGLSRKARTSGRVATGFSRKEGDIGALVGSVGKLAAPLAALAGIAASVGILIKLLIDAEAKTKGLNKTLMEGLGTTNLMGEGFRGMSRNVELLTKEAADLFRFMEMGLNAEEFSNAVVALDAAGVSVRKLTNGFQNADGLTEAIRGAQVVATTFGVTANEAIQNIGETVENLNMGYGETVERLIMISRLAKESGFNTKRFYSTVLSATTGMTMYNVRLEEAGMRLVQLTKAVGKQQAIQMLPGMAGGFKDEGMQERIKRLMITGGAGKRILKAEAGVLESRANKQLAKTGQTLESIAKMDRKTQTKFLSNLEYQKKGGVELANLIKNALEARGGARGGLGAQAQAMDQLSIGGKLAFQQAQLSKFVKGGFRNLDKAGAIQLMAAEQLTGMTMSEMKANARYFKSMEGVYNILKDSDMNDSDSQKALADKFGVKLDEEGRILSRDGEYLGANINEGFDKFLMASGNQAKIDEKVQKDQRQLMEEQVSMTQTLGDKIEQGVTYFLEMIWRNTNALIDMLPFVGEEQKKESRKRETLNEQRVLLEKLVEQLQANKKKFGKGGMGFDTQHIDDRIARHVKVLESIYAGENPFGEGAYKAGVRNSSGVLSTVEERAQLAAKMSSISGHGKLITGLYNFDSNPSPTEAFDAYHQTQYDDREKDFVYANGRVIGIDSKDQFIGGKVGGGAISALIENQDDVKDDITDLLKKQLEADKKYRKKFDENMKRDYPEVFAEKYIDALDMKEFENFLDVIGLTDAADRKAAMRTYERTGKLTGEAFDARTTARGKEFVIIGTTAEGQPIYEERDRDMVDRFGRFGKTPKLNDYIWRSGASAPISFSPDDTVIAMKDFSKLGGGGTIINIYGGDERKVFNVVKRAMRQMGRSA